MSFSPCCSPVGVAGPDNVVHTIINIGNEAEWYVVGTGPNPFELRTAESSDGTVGILQGASTVDFTVDFGANVSVTNIGIFAEWFVTGTENPFEFRTVQSSDGSVTVTQNADNIDLSVESGSGVEVFQVDDDSSTVSTTSTSYVTLATLATDPGMQILEFEEWKINLCLFVCHPANVFTVNTFVQWSIETAAGVFTQIDEWQINAPITIQVGTPSMPFHRTRNVIIGFDNPRMRVRVRMSALQASATFAEHPRWGGVQIQVAP